MKPPGAGGGGGGGVTHYMTVYTPVSQKVSKVDVFFRRRFSLKKCAFSFPIAL